LFSLLLSDLEFCDNVEYGDDNDDNVDNDDNDDDDDDDDDDNDGDDDDDDDDDDYYNENYHLPSFSSHSTYTSSDS
jgi:hypothetical protein